MLTLQLRKFKDLYASYGCFGPKLSRTGLWFKNCNLEYVKA